MGKTQKIHDRATLESMVLHAQEIIDNYKKDRGIEPNTHYQLSDFEEGFINGMYQIKHVATSMIKRC